jgi:hypothetical protein
MVISFTGQDSRTRLKRHSHLLFLSFLRVSHRHGGRRGNNRAHNDASNRNLSGGGMSLGRRQFGILIHLILIASVGRVSATINGQPPPPAIEILRIASGPRGSEVSGEFKLDEERTSFNRSSDTQVVVSFQWQGAPGVHRFAGRWRSPRGDLSISEFEYTARERRFGAYWTLPISPSTPVGEWSLEATVDGVPAGKAVFQIADNGQAAIPAVERRRLTPSVLYDQASSVYVTIERWTKVARLENAAGFLLGPGRIATAFAAIDAIDRAYVATSAGQRQEVTSILAWNRKQDWAIIATSAAPTSALPVAAGDAVKVGDRCYSLEAAGVARVLAECTLVGRTQAAGGGDQFLATFLNGTGVPGAPVLNEFGELLGAVGGGLRPGVTTVVEMLRARAEAGGVPIVPLTSFRLPQTPELVSIQELRNRNVLMAPLNGTDNIVSAGFAHQIQKNPVRPIDQRAEFSSQDGRLFVFVTWDPKERLRGMLSLRVYDEDNRVLLEGKPGKVDFKPGQPAFSQWEMSVPQPPGRYRVDVVFSDTPIWRGFLKVTG